MKSCLAVNDRVIMLKLRGKPLDIVQIHVMLHYTCQHQNNNEEVEDMYEKMEKLIKNEPNNKITLIIGNFRAKIGSLQYGKHVDSFNLGERKERGEKLLDFVKEAVYVVYCIISGL